MIEGARWRKWVFFYVPMAFFLLFLLFPFYWMVITSVRPDGELYRPWNSINYNPFWTWNPTWDHVRYLFEETLFASWLWNTTFIALASTAISLVCGVFAGYALSRLNFPFAGSLGTGLLSEGAAISLAMFPVLFLVVIIQLLYIRRVEVR